MTPNKTRKVKKKFLRVRDYKKVGQYDLYRTTAKMSWMKGMMPDLGGMGDMMKMMPALTKAKQAMENAKGVGQSRGTSSISTIWI